MFAPSIDYWKETIEGKKGAQLARTKAVRIFDPLHVLGNKISESDIDGLKISPNIDHRVKNVREGQRKRDGGLFCLVLLPQKLKTRHNWYAMLSGHVLVCDNVCECDPFSIVCVFAVIHATVLLTPG